MGFNIWSKSVQLRLKNGKCLGTFNPIGDVTKVQTYQLFHSTCSSSVTKIRVTSPLQYFSKHDHLDLSKASDSISDNLTLILPENFEISVFSAWVTRPECPNDEVKRSKGSGLWALDF